MSISDPKLFLLDEGFRWFGPADSTPLTYIRQAGAAAIFTALHQIPYGEVWPREAIRERKELIEAASLRWAAVESVPVHEDIKTGSGNLTKLFDNYALTLRNLAAEGIRLVIYNFMPVLDWVRTEMRSPLPDGSQCLRFDPVHFAAFEIHALNRPGAAEGCTPEQRELAAAWWKSLDGSARDTFIKSIIDVFPGVKWDLTLDDIRALLARYEQINEARLRANLARFQICTYRLVPNFSFNTSAISLGLTHKFFPTT
jgi:mannonate dehydratase